MCASTAPCTIKRRGGVPSRQQRSSRGSIRWGLCRVRTWPAGRPAGHVLDRGSTAACPGDGTPVTGRPRVSVLEGGRWSTPGPGRTRRTPERTISRRDSCAGLSHDTDRSCPEFWFLDEAYIRPIGWTARGGIICQSEVIGTVCRQRGCWVVITRLLARHV